MELKLNKSNVNVFFAIDSEIIIMIYGLRAISSSVVLGLCGLRAARAMGSVVSGLVYAISGRRAEEACCDLRKQAEEF